ncbi:MotA/TolQ/ExbB proton channel family protein [Porticoccaceae bacterium]|jgi:chemotaxis protein MotA|nr:MotA/TolQ/ExbB proton channel family protein [Porticoccaceae bacterium]MDA8664060.1 MotA/TolQ/ExbB proton channel family protein [Porticoccaceae bacterium]MDA8681038.1 MotA/TolQ/ExbB proton channel family protein [Porticoccaceae bacterium]MDB2344101.1 MotA/TolQ/ExbB proton channel family protein [Porticoccaceae bacterium]MDB2635385.1 MotA/TolQ/ExbB proton channel family protein [Porticoccaceae bacterium]
MDIATIVGLLGAFGFISIAVQDPMALWDPNSAALVFGAAIMVTVMRSKLSDAMNLPLVIGKVFANKVEEPEELIDKIFELATIARKEGMIALERVEITNPFLARGVAGLVDGTKAEALLESLQRVKDKTASRHEAGADMLSAAAELSPGMGMIGTLIGLVNLLANLSDPSGIGPAMALALLTTLYGSLMANVFFIPMGMKLEGYARLEENNSDLIILGIMFIKSGTNPRLLDDSLAPFLAPKKLAKRQAEAT